MGGRISGVRTRVRTRRVVSLDTPAAGADTAITVPGGHVWTLHSLSGVLTTAVGSTGDLPAIQVTVDGDTIGRWPVLLALAASIAHRVTWSEMGYGGAMYDTEIVGIPRLVLPPGATISTLTLNLAAGDQWSAVRAYVTDEWIQRGPVDLARIELELVGVIEPSA